MNSSVDVSPRLFVEDEGSPKSSCWSYSYDFNIMNQGQQASESKDTWISYRGYPRCSTVETDDEFIFNASSEKNEPFKIECQCGSSCPNCSHSIPIMKQKGPWSEGKGEATSWPVSTRLIPSVTQEMKKEKWTKNQVNSYSKIQLDTIRHLESLIQQIALPAIEELEGLYKKFYRHRVRSREQLKFLDRKNALLWAAVKKAANVNVGPEQLLRSMKISSSPAQRDDLRSQPEFENWSNRRHQNHEAMLLETLKKRLGESQAKHAREKEQLLFIIQKFDEKIIKLKRQKDIRKSEKRACGEKFLKVMEEHGEKSQKASSCRLVAPAGQAEVTFEDCGKYCFEVLRIPCSQDKDFKMEQADPPNTSFRKTQACKLSAQEDEYESEADFPEYGDNDVFHLSNDVMWEEAINTLARELPLVNTSYPKMNFQIQNFPSDKTDTFPETEDPVQKHEAENIQKIKSSGLKSLSTKGMLSVTKKKSHMSLRVPKKQKGRFLNPRYKG